jgi:hypothetical protein
MSSIGQASSSAGSSSERPPRIIVIRVGRWALLFSLVALHFIVKIDYAQNYASILLLSKEV